MTLGEPPKLHPWLQVVQPGQHLGNFACTSFNFQDADAWLPKRTSAAIVCASKSPKDRNDEGKSGVCRVLRLLTEGSAALDLPAVEELVDKVLEHGGDEQTARIVWRASQSGRLDLPQSTLARLLEAHEGLLADLVETFLVEGLQSFEAHLGVVSAPATLASVIGTSRKLYTQTRQRALVILLQAFDAFHSEGKGGEVAEEVLRLLATKSEGREEEVQLQRNEDFKLFKDPAAATEDWSLENRLLLLQFPHVLPYLSSLTHLTH